MCTLKFSIGTHWIANGRDHVRWAVKEILPERYETARAEVYAEVYPRASGRVQRQALQGKVDHTIMHMFPTTIEVRIEKKRAVAKHRRVPKRELQLSIGARQREELQLSISAR